MQETRRGSTEQTAHGVIADTIALAEVLSQPGMSRKRTGQADLHMHTTASDGVGTVEQMLTFAQEHTNLDVIAITDHDTLDGALRARDLVMAGNYRFEFIVGEEISTREGHLLALFLERRVPAGLSIELSIDLVHEQGGLAIVAHPFNRVFRHSVQRPVMNRLLRQPAVHPDGIETLNGSFAGIGSSRAAMTLSRRVYRWAETGGSDAHTLKALGCARTSFVGQTASDLRGSLLARTTAPLGGYWAAREYVTLARHRVKYRATGPDSVAAEALEAEAAPLIGVR
ncbi:MAG: CehA/McbA family metallohydrolase [Ktedonobacterales bacterium]